MKCITLTASLLTIAAGAPFVAAQTPPPAPARTPKAERPATAPNAPAAPTPAPVPRGILARPFIDEAAIEEMRASAMALRAEFDMDRRTFDMTPMPALAPMAGMPAMPPMPA